MPPYLPPDPFEYRCELTLRKHHFGRDSASPTEAWYSSSIVLLDSTNLYGSGKTIQWTHFYKKSVPGDGTPYSATTALPPYPLNVTLGLRFTHPDPKGITPAHLYLSMPMETIGPVGSDVSTFATGAFSDKSLAVTLRTSRRNGESGGTSSLDGKVICLRTK